MILSISTAGPALRPDGGWVGYRVRPEADTLIGYMRQLQRDGVLADRATGFLRRASRQ
jgi:hypothetical protein